MRKISLILKKIARISYIIGSINLILGIILSFVHVPVSASTGITDDYNQVLVYQPSACTLAFKCETDTNCDPDPYTSFTVPAGYQICKIAIKAGTHYEEFSSDGCADISPPGGDGHGDYCAYGVGTDFGEAVRECEENGQTECYAISHSEFYIDALPPSPTPTDTDVPPSPTPTDTDVAPSPTPTDTDVPPTPTPTGQLTNTPTPTATDTSVPPTATPTSTILATLTTPTSTLTPPSDGTSTPVPTSTGSGEQVTPTDTQSVEETPGTLPPPQPTGTQPAVLIPVTGVNLNSPFVQLERSQSFLINLGFALLGMGLIFQGIGRKIEG